MADVAVEVPEELCVDITVADSEGRRLGAVCRTGFIQNIVNVGTHCLGADKEDIADFLVRKPTSYKA